VEELGMVNGWMQGMESHKYYLPDFERGDSPFEEDG
jgi:hypothetical protein